MSTQTEGWLLLDVFCCLSLGSEDEEGESRKVDNSTTDACTDVSVSDGTGVSFSWGDEEGNDVHSPDACSDVSVSDGTGASLSWGDEGGDHVYSPPIHFMFSDAVLWYFSGVKPEMRVVSEVISINWPRAEWYVNIILSPESEVVRVRCESWRHDGGLEVRVYDGDKEICLASMSSKDFTGTVEADLSCIIKALKAKGILKWWSVPPALAWAKLVGQSEFEEDIHAIMQRTLCHLHQAEQAKK